MKKNKRGNIIDANPLTLPAEDLAEKELSCIMAFCIGRIRFEGKFSTAIDLGFALNQR